MRTALIAALLALLQGCGFTLLRDDLSGFYADPATVAAEVLSEAPTQVSLLEAPGFMEQYGRKGLWQPLSFIKEVRGGLYLLEPYDPERIPVLFIHGAGGTPHDWRFFMQNLDLARYQVWVYYYPTGLPIETSAVWLDKFVSALHAKYRFERLVVAAHSMGGLVARRFLALNAPENKYSALLATFSTPWGGVPFAKLGARFMAYSVPSWRDLSPDSVFLRRLQTEPLPAGVKHHLFFAYRVDGDEFDSDGVISVASQLSGHKEAGSQVHGFRTDHSAILDDAAVFARFADLLASID
jgi:pimeloyl-ACP methyl ester carboxylesterase